MMSHEWFLSERSVLDELIDWANSPQMNTKREKRYCFVVFFTIRVVSRKGP